MAAKNTTKNGFRAGLRRELEGEVRKLAARVEQRRARLAEAEAEAAAAREVLDHSDSERHAAAWVEADRLVNVARVRLEVAEGRLAAAQEGQAADETAKLVGEAAELEATIASHGERVGAIYERLGAVAQELADTIEGVTGEAAATHKAIARLAAVRALLHLPAADRSVADPVHGFNLALLQGIRASGHRVTQIERWLQPGNYLSVGRPFARAK